MAELRSIQMLWMPDTGRLVRKSGTTFDPGTNQNVATETTIWTGRGRAVPSLSATKQESGEEIESIQSYNCALDIAAPIPHVGDIWITDSSPLDPARVGLRLIITGVSRSTYPTARRFTAGVAD
jgi:hypothetical protein